MFLYIIAAIVFFGIFMYWLSGAINSVVDKRVAERLIEYDKLVNEKIGGQFGIAIAAIAMTDEEFKEVFGVEDAQLRDLIDKMKALKHIENIQQRS